MLHKIQVGRDWREIQTDENGQIESIDETLVAEIGRDDIAACALALAKSELDDRYNNSQQIAMLDDEEGLRADRYIYERRGK